MRNVRNRFACVLAGLAVMLLSVSAAQAAVVWTAPDVSYEAPPSLVDYTLQINSTTGTDEIGSYNFQVTLTRLTGTEGSVVFGKPFIPTSNYVFTGTSAGYSALILNDVTKNNATTATADDAADVANSLTVALRNLSTIPLTIAAGTEGTWSVQFVTSNTDAFDGSFGNLANSTFDAGTIEVTAVPLPLAAWGGLALFGLVGAKKWRKNRAVKTA